MNMNSYLLKRVVDSTYRRVRSYGDRSTAPPLHDDYAVISIVLDSHICKYCSHQKEVPTIQKISIKAPTNSLRV